LRWPNCCERSNLGRPLHLHRRRTRSRQSAVAAAYGLCLDIDKPNDGEEPPMPAQHALRLGVAAIATVSFLIGFLLLGPIELHAQQSAASDVMVGDGDLGGVVTGPHGPEAGVWVIAETTDLPTK